MILPPTANARHFSTQIWAKYLAPRLSLATKVGWVSGAYISQQGIRLASSVLLAWLLAPKLIGTMMLINTLRTGGELLTDIGIGQSIVNNPRGNDPDFYNTAWTIQIIRGVLLFIAVTCISGPLANFYDSDQLKVLLRAVAPIFLLTGITSPAKFLLQKNLNIRIPALFDLIVTIAATVVQLFLALLMPNVWALIYGLLIGTAISAFGSFLLMDSRTLRLKLEKQSVLDVIDFGKWMFFSSLIFFAAMNFDRLYFADAISFALLGVYGIARNFADTFMQLFQRVGNLMIFPSISGSSLRGSDLGKAISSMRKVGLAGTAVVLAALISIADQFIYLAYDPRYYSAGLFLTVLLVVAWFGIMATMADAVMMGVGKPSGMAISNGAKLLIIGVGLPYLLPQYGMTAALAVFLAAEFGRYLVLTWRQHKIGIGFIKQDICLTISFFVLTVVFRELTRLLGWTDGFQGWLHLGQQSLA